MQVHFYIFSISFYEREYDRTIFKEYNLKKYFQIYLQQNRSLFLFRILYYKKYYKNFIQYALFLVYVLLYRQKPK